MTEEQIKHMAERFLGWRLPEDFNPDGGISFKRFFNEHLPTPSKSEPVGTNLFTYDQAVAMLRYLAEGLTDPAYEAVVKERDMLLKAGDNMAKALKAISEMGDSPTEPVTPFVEQMEKLGVAPTIKAGK